MKLSDIFTEANARVPNAFTDAQRVSFLNELNNEFFDVVKIPVAASFTTISGTSGYVISGGTAIRAKNIGRVHVGTSIYNSFLYDPVGPTNNVYLFDETAGTIALTPAPVQTGLAGLVRYYKSAVTSFLSSDLTVSPDAPSEYHWIYILGLCEKIALALDDIPRSANYGQQYRGQLAVAQANYAQANYAQASYGQPGQPYAPPVAADPYQQANDPGV